MENKFSKSWKESTFYCPQLVEPLNKVQCHHKLSNKDNIPFSKKKLQDSLNQL